MASSGIKISRMGPFEFNPCGNVWFKNENTFGRRLLSKMGWSQGKGLGRNEDGIKENIKISLKDDNAGIGYKKDVNIAVGCTEYENILNKLQHHFKKDETKRDVDSSEQRSCSSTNGLLYRKCVRRKDVCQLREKDMKAIFLDNPPESNNNESEKEEDTTYKSQLDMKEYFALKMKQKFGNHLALNSDEKSFNSEDNKQNLSSPASPKKRKKIEKSGMVKRIKLECEETLDEIYPKVGLAKEKSRILDTSGITPSTNKINKLWKNAKSKKKKLIKIANLKSCLKSTSACRLVATRNVSFNDVVDFKFFDSTMEENFTTTNDGTVQMNAECESSDIISENIEVHRTHLINDSDCSKNNIEVDKNIINKSNSNGTEINNYSDAFNLKEENLENISKKELTDISDKNSSNSDQEASYFEEQSPQCLDLPKNSRSNFNVWLESQRQAVKMKLYKDMIKKLQKHDILSTSNIVDIKGYGNWGF